MSNKVDKKVLKEILESEKYSPEKLVKFFESYFPEEFDKGIGVGQGYTLKEHTLMVLKQFDKHFSKELFPHPFNNSFFRILLTLHDIGKPRAIEEENKKLQHEYTPKIALPVFQGAGFNDKQINVARILISRDPLGEFLKRGDIDNTIKEVVEMSRKSELVLKDFYKLLLIYYISDASSYTRDADPKSRSGGLDFLFDFSEEGSLKFSKKAKQKMEVLEKNLGINSSFP